MIGVFRIFTQTDITSHILCCARLLVCSILIISLGGIAGCSAPLKAPVSSREKASQRVVGKRPAYYRVSKGDSLYSISWRYGLSFRTLARWNGLKAPYTIYPGQRLRLHPVRQTTAKPAPTRKSSSTSQIKKSQATTKKTVPSGNKKTTKKTTSALKLNWQWPTQGVMVQRFAKGDPLRKGITIGGKLGSSIRSAESGKVVYAGSGLIGYGKLIIIKHNKNYLSAYGYNRRILVKEGDQVKRGTHIAEMGKDGTGRPLLHFEIRRNGAPTDPVRVLPRRR